MGKVREGENGTYVAKAGKYYIGDPCYVFSREDWDELGDQTDWFNKTNLVEFRGHTLFAAHTAYGDGSYEDNEGYVYPVDAGLIGIVPIELVSKPEGLESGRVKEFETEFSVATDIGLFAFDRIVIDTRGEE